MELSSYLHLKVRGLQVYVLNHFKTIGTPYQKQQPRVILRSFLDSNVHRTAIQIFHEKFQNLGIEGAIITKE